MSNRWYYFKVYLLQYKAYFALGIGLAALILAAVIYIKTPKIPKTEQDFSNALDEGVSLFEAKRYEEAYQMLIYPAQHGYPRAKYLIAELYYHGWGTDHDVKLAFENYRSAAETMVEAKYKMAAMAFRGETKDMPKGKATTLLTETAYHGYGPAQKELGIYSLMSGDYEQAYFWLSLASRDGDPKALKALKKASEHLTDYQRGLLDTEIKDFFARK